jgi:hypothetical protein
MMAMTASNENFGSEKEGSANIEPLPRVHVEAATTVCASLSQKG